jgi:hypothetical protein
MSQEKMVKFLLIAVLFYLALPVLSFNGPTMHTMFSVVWTGLASLLFAGLMIKTEPAKIRKVKKKAESAIQQNKKRASMGS